MFALGAILLYLMIELWPAIQAAAKSGNATAKVTWFGHDWKPTADVALLALVVLSSSLDHVHAAVWFADYVGNRGFVVSWVWWYLLRVFVGSAAGRDLLRDPRGLPRRQHECGRHQRVRDRSDLGLVGLFSKQATDKLREVFDTAFRVNKGGDHERADNLDSTPGALESATPSLTTPPGPESDSGP